MAIAATQETVGVVGVGLVFGALWSWFSIEKWHRWRVRRRLAQRGREAERAAVAASIEDEAFSPELIRAKVINVLDDVAAIWASTDADEIDASASADMTLEWAKAHYRGRGTRLAGEPRIDLLRIVKRRDHADQRVQLRVRVGIYQTDVQSIAAGHVAHRDQRWTLARVEGDWSLVSSIPAPLSGPTLTLPQITTDADDEDRLYEQVLEERARSSPPLAAPASKDPRADLSRQLHDLAVIDERYAPALIDTTLRRVIEAWEDASMLGNRALLTRATAAAVNQLRLPESAWPGASMVIKDTSLIDWQITDIAELEHHTQLSVTVTINAVRYLLPPKRTVRVPIGYTPTPRPISMTWTLQATDAHNSTWRLIHSTNPCRTAKKRRSRRSAVLSSNRNIISPWVVVAGVARAYPLGVTGPSRRTRRPESSENSSSSVPRAQAHAGTNEMNVRVGVTRQACRRGSLVRDGRSGLRHGREDGKQRHPISPVCESSRARTSRKRFRP